MRAARRLVVVVDTSLLKLLDRVNEALLGRRGLGHTPPFDEGPWGVEKDVDKLFEQLRKLCRDIVHSAGVVYVYSKVKREHKVLKRTPQTLLDKLLSACRVGGTSAARHHASPTPFEDKVLAPLCGNSKSRRLVEHVCRSHGLEECCRREAGVLRRLVDEDLHLAMAALLLSSRCHDVLVITLDSRVGEKIRQVRGLAGGEEHLVGAEVLER